MKIKLSLSIALLFIFSLALKSQSDTYEVKKASFSSDRYDEFSPVFHKNGIVLGSNRGGSSWVDYTGNQGKGPVSMFFVERDTKGKWKRTKLFSKDLTTEFNDGPCTFNSDGDMIFYSRNMFVIRSRKENPYYRNKLGLFSAVKTDKKWTAISPFRHNNDWFNISTPSLSPDGKRLYFSSDKPDGFGGADLYYCDWKDGYWDEPINLGSEVNTAENEAYPFMNAVGELFFSSNGHQGMGGKDIFVTKQKGEDWHKPVHLDSPINSEHDDFGIVADVLTNSGYFSSQRDRTIDIYSFSTLKQPVWFSSPQKQNNYCVILKDEDPLAVDTLLFQYEWDFGGGLKQYGSQVRHCFPDTGSYTIDLNVVVRRTKEMFFHKATYKLDMMDLEQPFIRSKDFVRVGDSIRIDGLKTNYSKHDIIEYYWQLNDTTFKTGADFYYQFNKTGENRIQLAVALKSKSSGEISKHAVSKVIAVYSNNRERDELLAKQQSTVNQEKATADAQTFKIKRVYGAGDNKAKESVFRLQLLVSNKKVSLESSVFAKVPSKYQIQERFNREDSTYAYIVEEQTQLISLFPSYQEIKASGFEAVTVTYNLLSNPSEIELFRIKEKYGSQINSFFNDRNVLITNGILMLNNVVALMNKYPKINLEVNVHTDNIASQYQNLNVSKSLANNIVDYLVGSGINKDRLIPQGKSEVYPIRSNLLESGREINRRVEFKITE